jgi:hypothetical protein
MWLPETAVDLESLEILAESGILFTILSPHQAKKVRKLSDEKWREVQEGELDPSMPYLCLLPSGRRMNIYFYDAPISREVAFGNLLNSGDQFASKLFAAFREERNRPQIVHIATDGETFGHHHSHADMALAYTLYTIESKNNAKLTNYGEYLAKTPPTHQVEIVEKSSWSCSHGIERWRSNCGCNIGQFPGGKQPWRAPLREALDWLRDQTSAIYEEEVSRMLRNPWEARNDYVEVISERTRTTCDRFLERHSVKSLNPNEISRALTLLEMQRYAMLMYTSCGWFFDDISGIESVQILQYACRVIQLAEEIRPIPLEPEFIELLRAAPSLIEGDGAVVYDKFVKPSRMDLKRVGAHHALLSLFESRHEPSKFYCYSFYNQERNPLTLGKMRLVTGTSRIQSDLTRDDTGIGSAVLDLGGHHLICGIAPQESLEAFSKARIELEAAFMKGDLSEASRLLYKHFGKNHFSIFNLFKDEQKKLLEAILNRSIEDFSTFYAKIQGEVLPIFPLLESLQIVLPDPFLASRKHFFIKSLEEALRRDDLDFVELNAMVSEVKPGTGEFNMREIERLTVNRIEESLNKMSAEPDDIPRIETIEKMIKILEPLQLNLNLWKSQNLYYSIGRRMIPKMEKRSREGETFVKEWISSYKDLGRTLHVKLF